MQIRLAYFPIDSAPSEEDMDLDAFDVSGKGKQKCYEVDYTTLSQRDIEHLMRQDIDHISGIFGIDVSRICPASQSRS